MTKTRIGLVSLGCPKNLVDAEEMLGALSETGQAEFVGDARRADVLVVNTCAFIESAKQESIDAILNAVQKKGKGQVQKVIVTGCLAQRYGAELALEIPEVDAFLGIQSAPQIANAVFGTRGRSLPMMQDQANAKMPLRLPYSENATEAPAERVQITALDEKYPLIPPARVRSTAPWTAYLKVSEGCDHGCTFCAIPNFRGKHRSKPLERIIDEAQRLVDSGTTELNLIAQDVTAYGMDLYNELALPRLLEALGKIDDLKWVRLLYCYPTMVTDRLIRTMADTPNVAHYVDIPLQHGDDGMLKRMKRGGSVASYLRLFDRFRAAMSDMTIRTTFLVGFPGEDDNAFNNLKTFVEQAQFDRLGVFTYSPEEGTPGFEMTPRVSKKIAENRRRELMELQQPISLACNERLVNKEISVLIEDRRGNDLVARSWRDAPEIDGNVIVKGKDGFQATIENTIVGQWLPVRVIEARPYDVVAVPVDGVGS